MINQGGKKLHFSLTQSEQVSHASLWNNDNIPQNIFRISFLLIEKKAN